MKYILATVLLMLSFVVQTNYAQQQPASPPLATRTVETESFVRTAPLIRLSYFV